MGVMPVQYLVYVVAVIFGGWLTLLPPSQVFATHENDHRFVVEGHITDSNGNGIPNVKVFVRAEVLEAAVTAFSDPSGFYSALLHLHDADAGMQVTVTALGETESITADFDPEDKTTPRRGTVNMIYTVPEQENVTTGSDSDAYLTWAIVALGAGVSFGVLARRWSRRRRTQSR